jgi:hypothetical protein
LKADNYRGCSSWIDNTPIDLNAQGPGITQQDFLQMKEHENACKWDVLSLSLVLNFVPDPRERGTRILLAGISFTPHIFREDAAVCSLVSRRFTYAFGPLVRDGWFRSGLTPIGGSPSGVASLALSAKFALPHSQPF